MFLIIAKAQHRFTEMQTFLSDGLWLCSLMVMPMANWYSKTNEKCPGGLVCKREKKITCVANSTSECWMSLEDTPCLLEERLLYLRFEASLLLQNSYNF